jgi:hypothetical protein
MVSELGEVAHGLATSVEFAGVPKHKRFPVAPELGEALSLLVLWTFEHGMKRESVKSSLVGTRCRVWPRSTERIANDDRMTLVEGGGGTEDCPKENRQKDSLRYPDSGIQGKEQSGGIKAQAMNTADSPSVMTWTNGSSVARTSERMGGGNRSSARARIRLLVASERVPRWIEY